MSIRNKLTLQFAGIFAIILILFSLTVYYFTSLFRANDFFNSLEERATATALFVLETDEVSPAEHQLYTREYYRSLPEEIVQVYDSQGHLIFAEGEGDLHITPDLLNKLKEQKIVRIGQDNRQVLGMLYKDNQGEFAVFASGIDWYSLTKLSTLKKILITGVCFAMLVVMVAGWLFSRSALRPIARVIREVESINASDLHRRLSYPDGKDEIWFLAHTFNKMLDRLENAFEMQTTFVSSASHELRTPLTAMMGEIEVALMKNREPAEYHRVLESILDDARILARLSNGLLQIAQASTDESKIRTKPLRFDELIWSAQEEAQKRHPQIRYELDFENYPEDEEALMVNGNESLLQVAFLNVFENAGKFSRPGQKVTALLSRVRQGFTVLVKDQGVGIQKDDLVNVFVPFFRAHNVREISGHGIGLPLAERILKLHKGTIQVHSRIGEGTEVFIYLPARR
ncbi:HAMP domain-containing sensor histidine kinase [Adhaeribacter soli]|uniref:histidine kinase n=1 Tax=Adhaeribacter soli TaxID=2607655 RepID=A0A5N1JAL4_9BACT|nr:HAMP domain-containing sensor histidine kinase [Adhaeribacter soli]KAA9345899.1 HAMP domain-containing histidine kinase [Adhaeribacter soli]